MIDIFQRICKKHIRCLQTHLMSKGCFYHAVRLTKTALTVYLNYIFSEMLMIFWIDQQFDYTNLSKNGIKF